MAPTASDLAAIVCASDLADSDAVDALVLGFCQGLQRAGWRVGGLVQRRLPAPGGGKPLLELQDVRTGQLWPISQRLGILSRACSLDTCALAQASGVLRQALADGVQLAVTNRFGELEAAGGGFAAELAALAGAGIPVLTVTGRKHVQAWRCFTGGLGAELPAQPAALHAWFTQAAGRGVPA